MCIKRLFVPMWWAFSLGICFFITSCGGGGGDNNPELSGVSDNSVLNVVGTWTGTASDSSGPGTMTLTLNQEGSRVGGSCDVCTPGGNCINGSVEAVVSGTISFDGKINDTYSSGTCSFTLYFTSDISGGIMSGIYNGTNSCSGGFDNGTFNLQKQ